MRSFELPIAVSNSHIHLSKEDAMKLFGTDALVDAGSKGHPTFNVSEHRVSLVGPKGTLKEIRVLIPFTRETWVELNPTHTFQLGLRPPLEKGELPGGHLCIEGPKGKVETKKNVVVELRHLEVSSQFAKQWDLTQSMVVSAEISGPRGLLLRHVSIRILDKVRPGFTGYLEIDRDEANAALVKTGDIAKIIVD